MAEKFDEFMDEIENDIRQEKWMSLWKKYGTYVTGTFVGLMVFAVGYNYWQSHQQDHKEDISHKLIMAQEFLGSGNVEGALSVVKSLAQEKNTIYRGLAYLTAAAAHSQEGPNKNITEALRLLTILRTDKNMEPIIQDMALLQYIRLQMGEQASTQDLLKQIEPACEKSRPWFYLAAELKGVLLQQLGKSPEALTVFSELIKDLKTPEGIMMRAQIMLQTLQSH